ncbi:2-hydroxyacyl-CoA dehydratase subunit D [Thermodesulfobacteriota bacterium]
MKSEEKIKTRKAKKTLKTAREAPYLGKKVLDKAIQARKEGRPVAWSMYPYYQDLIAKALGVEVIFPENYGAFCASERKAEPYLERSDADGFPSTICGYARTVIGYTSMLAENNMVAPPGAPGGGMPKPTVLFARAAACDTGSKWFQAMGRYMDVPVWLLELPHTGVKEFYLPGNKELNIQFLKGELKKFVSFLENLLGTKMDWDKLREVVDQTLKTLRLAYEVDLLRMAIPSPMISQDFWSMIIAHLYLPEDPETTEFYQRVYDEVKYRVDHKIGAIPNEKYRMMFAELPPWHSLGFFDDLKDHFGIAMVMESWGYHIIAPIPEEEIQDFEDPLEIIARMSYKLWSQHNDAALKYGAGPAYFMASYLQWAEEYKVDGFFAHPLMTCRAATYTLLYIKNLLMDKLKVPGVIIEGDIIDLRVFNEEEAFSKIEAFIETMDHYREIRQNEGMDW